MTGKVMGALVGAAALVAAAGDAAAQKSQDTLRVAFRQIFASTDAYFNNNREAQVYSKLVWDTLIERDPVTFEYKPLLATSWTWVNDTTLDLELRRGVKFHDGTDFEADDVVYTFNYVAKPESKATIQRNVSWIREVEKLDAYKVRIHLKEPFPPAIDFLALVFPVYPKEYYEKVGPTGMSAAPVGTGPYRSTRIVNGERYELERNDAYFADGPKGKPKVGKIVIRMIPDETTQIAELLGGGLDWIWNLGADQTERIGRMSNFRGVQAETMRITYVSFDAAGRSGFEPLKNLKVRQAIAHAINREAMVQHLVRGDARVVHAPCNPVVFGCDESKAVRYAYDPQKAKQLLAEAGFANGFAVDFYGVRSREWSEAIVNDLRAVGITARLNQVPALTLVDKTRKGETPMFFWDWAGFSINDASATISNFFKGSGDDFARDKEIMGWLEIADAVTDPAVRKENYGKAIAKVTAEAYWLPGFTVVTNYAHSAALDFTAFKDEFPRFYLYGWK